MVSTQPRISFTTFARSTPDALLFGPHRLDGVELRSPRGGVDPEEAPCPARGAEGEYHRPGRDAHRNFLQLAGEHGPARPEEHAHQPAQPRERHRLDQELGEDAAPARAQGLADADLSRP